MRLHALAAATALALSAVAAAPAFAGRVELSGLQSDTAFDQFIVKYRTGTPEAANPAAIGRGLDLAAASVVSGAQALRGDPRGARLDLVHHRRMAIGADVVRASRKLDRIDAETLMRQLAADPNVEYVEVDKINRIALTPNDPQFGQQYGFGTGAGGIRATEAWDITSGAGTVVAVLDTGITSHPDLNANILPGYDFVSNATVGGDGNGRDSDPSDPGDFYGGDPSSWHGTHVAGTVAAVTNNGVGVAGTAYNAKVVPVRVLGRGGGYDSDIADAVIWASGGSVSGVPANANPAEVINLSLGGSGSCGSAMQSAINGAVGRGTTVVIAAGNSNANVSGFSPANCSNVVAVASNTSTGARSSFSNYGALIDVSAPGSSILSTLNTGTQGPGSPSYASYNGTSMAAPHVAGVVALMQSAASTPLTPAQVEAVLKSSARAFPSTPSQPIGAGIVNARAAVDAVGGGGGNAPPSAGFTSSINGLSVQFTDTSTDSDGSIASRSWNFGDGTSSTAANPSKTYAAAGTYSVSLTVTDDDGASNTRTQSVTVSSGGGSGNVLQNGVPATGLSASSGNWLHYTINVPAGASNLSIASSGGSGDADLYVRFGSQPTTSAYDCRPYRSGNAETCSFATPQAGTYHVSLRAYSTFSGVSLVGSYGAGGGGGSQTYSNGTDYSIPDNNATGVSSPITVSGRSGNAGSSVPVAVNIVHTYRGDLVVDLVAPDGSAYSLSNRSGGSADNINATYTLNLSSEPLNGTWRLRASDRAGSDTGYINSWSITF